MLVNVTVIDLEGFIGVAVWIIANGWGCAVTRVRSSCRGIRWAKGSSGGRNLGRRLSNRHRLGNYVCVGNCLCLCLCHRWFRDSFGLSRLCDGLSLAWFCDSLSFARFCDRRSWARFCDRLSWARLRNGLCGAVGGDRNTRRAVTSRLNDVDSNGHRWAIRKASLIVLSSLRRDSGLTRESDQ